MSSKDPVVTVNEEPASSETTGGLNTGSPEATRETGKRSGAPAPHCARPAGHGAAPAATADAATTTQRGSTK